MPEKERKSKEFKDRKLEAAGRDPEPAATWRRLPAAPPGEQGKVLISLIFVTDLDHEKRCYNFL